jgi:hypothetical protein
MSASGTEAGFACTLTDAEFRERRAGLLATLASRVREREDTGDGVAFRFDPSDATLGLIAEMIRLERQCCAFLRFALIVEPDPGPIRLAIGGPEGTREFVRDLLPAADPPAVPREP